MDYALSSLPTDAIDKLFKLTIADEGYRQFRYQDTLGIWTFGIGFKESLGLSLEECIQVLKIRFYKLEKEVISKIPVYSILSPERKIILLEMCYQMGVGGVLAFEKMIRALEKEDYETASQEMLNSQWAQQTPKRAEKYSVIMESNHL